MDPVNVPAKFEVRSFVQSLDTPFNVIKVTDFGTNRKRVYFMTYSY